MGHHLVVSHGEIPSFSLRLPGTAPCFGWCKKNKKKLSMVNGGSLQVSPSCFMAVKPQWKSVVPMIKSYQKFTGLDAISIVSIGVGSLNRHITIIVIPSGKLT